MFSKLTNLLIVESIFLSFNAIMILSYSINNLIHQLISTYTMDSDGLTNIYSCDIDYIDTGSVKQF